MPFIIPISLTKIPYWVINHYIFVGKMFIFSLYISETLSESCFVCLFSYLHFIYYIVYENMECIAHTLN